VHRLFVSFCGEQGELVSTISGLWNGTRPLLLTCCCGVGLHASAGARDRRVILIMRDNVWYADSISGVCQSLPTLRSASLTAET
jgi:hypothetical protein